MRLSALLALFLTILPATARSAESIAVVGTGTCDDASLAEHVRTVREALTRKLGPVVRSETEILQPLGGLPRGSLAGAIRLVEEAESTILSNVAVTRAVGLKRDQRAHELLESALEVLRSISPSPERSQTLLKVRTLELQLYSGSGRRAELEQALEAIFRLDPTFTFDPNTYSPPQLAQFEEVRAKLEDKSRATLAVTTRPEKMVVYVDGHDVGPAPLTLRLPAGTYRVETASGPHRGLSHIVNLQDQAQLDIDGEFERSVELEGGPCVAAATYADRSARLVRLGGLIGATTVVGVRTEKGPTQETYVVAQVFEAGSGPNRNGVAMKLVEGKPAPGALAKLWDVLGSKKGQLEISPPDSVFMAAVPPPRPPPPAWMRPSAYVAGGLAVGFAALGVVKGISSHDSYSKAHALRDPGGLVAQADVAAYKKAIEDGDSARKTMYVSIGTAVVFGGVAGVLGYLSREPGPPVIRF